jgi:hypothetical protein
MRAESTPLLKVTAFHPNFTKLNDFVVDDKPNDIKGSSTYFNLQARVHAMIEIFSQVTKLFFSRLLLSAFKEFSLYQEIPSR